jgi:hypothetical protein
MQADVKIKFHPRLKDLSLKRKIGLHKEVKNNNSQLS